MSLKMWVGQGVENILDVLPSTVKEQCFPLRILCSPFSFEKELEATFPASPSRTDASWVPSVVAFAVERAYVSKFDVYCHFPVFMSSRNLLTIAFYLRCSDLPRYKQIRHTLI